MRRGFVLAMLLFGLSLQPGVALLANPAWAVHGQPANEGFAHEETADEEPADDGHADERHADAAQSALADELYAALEVTQDFRDSFVHGYKGPEHQLYIVLHDTEGDGDAAGIIEWWDSCGAGVAAHFVINLDGSIWQCVPLDAIAHHAGYGDAGHNDYYGVGDESRDDFVGTVPIGDWAPDYGMNSHSIGIELVHAGYMDDYPPEQLEALDALIAYIDAYYGFESQIIDHKDWRSTNSDTSPEFAEYLLAYKQTRTHNGAGA